MYRVLSSIQLVLLVGCLQELSYVTVSKFVIKLKLKSFAVTLWI